MYHQEAVKVIQKQYMSELQIIELKELRKMKLTRFLSLILRVLK